MKNRFGGGGVIRGSDLGSEYGKTRRSEANVGSMVVAIRVERAGAAHSHTVRTPAEWRCRET